MEEYNGIEEMLKRKAQRIDALKTVTGEIIGDAKKITLEIGCGKGHYLSSYAAAHPKELCIGIDLISERIKDSKRRAEKKGAANAHFVKAEAGEFLASLPENCVIENIFIMFPDPWPKKRHHKRRLIQEPFIDTLRTKCSPETVWYFRTDYDEYFEWAKDVVNASHTWRIDEKTELPFEEVSQFQRILKVYNTFAARPVFE